MLLKMLEYRRPEGSITQKDFCDTYLLPIMGEPDEHGNYIHIIEGAPNLCFAAHHDTVHRIDGMQEVSVSEDGMARTQTEASSCLGADCTTGIWLILEMIRAKVPGIYVVHAAEEVGCVGSSALVKSAPEWLSGLDAVISFDRYGTKSVITHQMGLRTASDEFAKSLAATLGLDMEPDSGGTYTDSNEYAEHVSECTNISVGYYNQHSKVEKQDMAFAYRLRDALITADFSNLVFTRDPSVVEYDDFNWFSGQGRGWKSSSWWDQEDEMDRPYTDPMAEVIADHPEDIARMLREWGFNTWDLYEELGINPFENERDDAA